MIELVMVIVIIGVLSAAALPRFFNSSVQATTAMNQGNAAALRSAVNIAHVAWIALGAPNAASYPTVDGYSISLNSHGWPSFWAINGSTNPTYCANTIQSIDGTGGTRKPLLVNFPQVISADATVGGSCQSAPCACTEDICYLASSPVGGTCLYTLTLNGATYTITYSVLSGAVTASP